MNKLKLAVIALLFLASCTDNESARNFGGTQTLLLQQNERFINVTWKGDDIWLIVQDTITGNYEARESSNYGILEGKITIKKK